MQILNARQAENERSGAPAPDGLRQSISGFGQQLHDVHRRQAELGGPPSPASDRAPEATGRFAKRSFTARV